MQNFKKLQEEYNKEVSYKDANVVRLILTAIVEANKLEDEVLMPFAKSHYREKIGKIEKISKEIFDVEFEKTMENRGIFSDNLYRFVKETDLDKLKELEEKISEELKGLTLNSFTPEYYPLLFLRDKMTARLRAVWDEKIEELLMDVNLYKSTKTLSKEIWNGMVFANFHYKKRILHFHNNFELRTINSTDTLNPSVRVFAKLIIQERESKIESTKH